MYQFYSNPRFAVITSGLQRCSGSKPSEQRQKSALRNYTCFIDHRQGAGPDIYNITYAFLMNRNNFTIIICETTNHTAHQPAHLLTVLCVQMTNPLEDHALSLRYANSFNVVSRTVRDTHLC